jgi:hypothetical protein
MVDCCPMKSIIDYECRQLIAGPGTATSRRWSTSRSRRRMTVGISRERPSRNSSARRPTVASGLSAQPCADELVTPKNGDFQLYMNGYGAVFCRAKEQRETAAA